MTTKYKKNKHYPIPLILAAMLLLAVLGSAGYLINVRKHENTTDTQKESDEDQESAEFWQNQKQEEGSSEPQNGQQKDKDRQEIDTSELLNHTEMPILKLEPVDQPYGTTGRWFEKEVEGETCLTTINMGSSLNFQVAGTENVILDFKVLGKAPSIAYSIDQLPYVRTDLGDQSIHIGGLNRETDHTVTIVSDMISESNDLWNKEEGVLFQGARLDEGGRITGLKPSNKKILYRGDSVTAGIRVGATGSFAFYTSKALNCADIRYAFGYTGILEEGPFGIPNAMGYTDSITANVPDTMETPDIIVVNYGTNDALQERNKEEFQLEFEKFLQKLNEKYSHAPTFVMIPFHQGMREEIISAVSGGTSNLYLVDTKGWGLEDADVHPDIESAKSAGNRLAVQILQTLGAEFFQ